MTSEEWIDHGRAKCQACVHSFTDDDRKQDRPGTIMRCALLPCSGRGKFQYAIYAREESFCGATARKFQAKEGA